MRLLSQSLLALGAVTVLSTSLAAQTPTKRGSDLRSSIRSRVDTNNDGEISQDELQAARKHMLGKRGQDADPDKLRENPTQRRRRPHGADDLDPQGQAPHKGQHEVARPGGSRPQHRPEHKNGQADATKGLGPLARFDLNDDGVIGGDEAQRAQALLQRFRELGERSRANSAQRKRPGSGPKPPAQGNDSRSRQGHNRGTRPSAGQQDAERRSSSQKRSCSGNAAERTRRRR